MKSFLGEYHSYYFLAGGRGSLKSTAVSLLIVYGITKSKHANAICMRKFKTDLRNSVYGQIIKAIEFLGLEEDFAFSKTQNSTPNIIYKKTGQQIYFTGIDDVESIKSIVSDGYFKYSWIEEASQIDSEFKLRSVLQSVRRGGEKFCTFYTYNPPRSPNHWLNLYANIQKNQPNVYYSLSSYINMPPNLAKICLGQDWINDAESLKRTCPLAYKHEYLGLIDKNETGVFKNIKAREISDYEDYKTPIVSVDFGVLNEPFILCLTYFDVNQNTFYILQEIYIKSMDDSRIIKDFKKEVGDLFRHCVVRFVANKSQRAILEKIFKGYIKFEYINLGEREFSYYLSYLCSIKRIIIDTKKCPRLSKELKSLEERRKCETSLGKENIETEMHFQKSCGLNAVVFGFMAAFKPKCGW